MSSVWRIVERTEKFGNHIRVNGETIRLLAWFRRVYLTEIYGIYTPRLGGWA